MKAKEWWVFLTAKFGTKTPMVRTVTVQRWWVWGGTSCRYGVVGQAIRSQYIIGEHVSQRGGEKAENQASWAKKRSRHSVFSWRAEERVSVTTDP